MVSFSFSFSFLFLLFLSFPLLCFSANSILDYGALPSDLSNSACWTNSKAITKTIMAANASSDNVVLIPANYSFCYFYVEVYNIYNVTMQIDGTLVISNNITEWPKSLNHTLASFYFYQSAFVTWQGTGMIDGQGYDWWWFVVLTTIDNRPHMIMMEEATNLTFQGGLRFRNSPQYHLLLWDVVDVYITNIDIYVNVTDQQELLRTHSLLTEEGIPIFPLNTDGIDPAGKNVFIENVRIENFDDAVAVKPLNGGNFYSNCSQNVTVRNSFVKFGVGMTIGSVPPDDKTNCIRDVLFENIEFEDPFKAIYVKTNPGWSGNGIINNITYRNITASGSIWYPLWIGPQQEKQPGRPGTGCSFEFPIVMNCSTQPRVTVSDIFLEDITFVNGHNLPGVLLCNETNPCTNFQFNNVKNTGFFEVQKDYYCDYVSGSSSNSLPEIPCL